MKFKIGDKVILNGYIYVSSNASTPTRKITNKITNVTRIATGSRHPYNTTGDLGWCDESSLKLYEEDKKYECDKVILATGGKSYPLTGSTGDGYKMAKALGHTITPIKPSLVPLEVYEKEEEQKKDGKQVSS